ncbi:MAG: epoxyqueuosine reductase [Oscillospiraceae bacterium]|nr:epoxyqueuosine reductase [Oscillospiraceae bacterium]
MTREKLQKLVDDFSDNSPTNYLSIYDESQDENNYAKNNLIHVNTSGKSLSEGISELVGMRFFQRPIFSAARADDPGFAEIKRPELVGEHHMMPHDWLPEAKTVISFYLPMEKAIVEANKKDPVEPAMEWLCARVDGQRFLLALGAAIRDALIADGYKTVTPYTDDRFVMTAGPGPGPGPGPRPGDIAVPPFSSNWSERHIGVITGLGTFGMSTNFISKAGSAGRIISVVTEWETEPDSHDYDDWLGYCNRCGACIRKCPAQAHFPDRHGKDHAVCGGFIGKTCAKYMPRYGCGKCQTGTPCEYTRM